MREFRGTSGNTTSDMSSSLAVEIQSISYSYADVRALNQVSFNVGRPEIFALLGPNGGGKSTLFKILSTQVVPQAGTAKIMGYNVSTHAPEVRRNIGVVFQSPSVDKKLTAEENLMHQGHLYGMSGKSLRGKIANALETVGLETRSEDRVEHLSGGMQRRVEIAKSLLHEPSVLLLDEPSAGLDPSARLDMWSNLVAARDNRNMTSLLTTHLMEEAEKADRVGIIHEGQLVACGTPGELKAMVGGEVLELETDHAQALKAQIRDGIGCEPVIVGDRTIRIDQFPAGVSGPQLLIRLAEAFPGIIRSSRVGVANLEDVFVHCTGRKFEQSHSTGGDA